VSTDLKRFAAFAELGESELELLDELLEPLRFDRGQQLFREGQEADGLWLVEEGRVGAASERAGRLGSLGPGEGMGALSLVVVGPRALTALAEEPVRVLRLTRTAFHRLCEDSPRAGARILAWVVRELAAPLRAGLERVT
jgi:CRP-like cAMP-binding protein